MPVHTHQLSKQEAWAHGWGAILSRLAEERAQLLSFSTSVLQGLDAVKGMKVMFKHFGVYVN